MKVDIVVFILAQGRGSLMRILIADDHPVVRRGLVQILADSHNKAFVGEAKDAYEAMDMIRGHAWDVILVDITMPGKSGLDLLKELRCEYPKLPVLILSIHPEEQFAVRVLKAGAAGYITKETCSDVLLGAIRKVIQGGKYVSSALAERLAIDLETDFEKPRHEKLSDREYQVLRMLASGKPARDMAKVLSLSVKTIHTYRARVLEKMQMKSNTQLIQYAVQNRLVD
ncbi:MAG: response regulator transcription factor [Acidobacteria bacterium]|nr:response regulator transcription factor [Acidobacteriota bacterium]MBI3655103.1 response regulator transcription factor [Acidobacteriota bacterium]